MYRNITYKVDENWEGEIRLDTWDENGNPVTEYYNHKSWCYFESPKGTFNSMFGTKVEYKEFKNVIQRSQWLKEHKLTKKIYECLQPQQEFLMLKYEGQQEKPEFLKNTLRKYVIDIEVETFNEFPDPEKADYRINVICIYDNITNKFYTWVLPNSKYHKSDIKFENTEDTEYFVYRNETEMLCNFAYWMHDNFPDVLTGWNIDGFDIPYICTRIAKVCDVSVMNKLSPVDIVKEKIIQNAVTKKLEKRFEIQGITILDLMFLYKTKYQVEKLPSYSLESVAQAELGLGKMEYEGTIHQFWQRKFMDFVEYCRIDVKRTWEIEVKRKLIEVTRQLCHIGLVEYMSIYTSKPYIYGALTLECHTMDYKIITYTPGMEGNNEKYEGAFVWDTVAGCYTRGIASFDVNSLYPNIIRSLNISPETKIGKVIDETDPDCIIFKMRDGKVKYFTAKEFKNLKQNSIQAANKVFYFKHAYKEGVLTKFVGRLYNKRVAIKGLMKDEEKAIIKIDEQLKSCTDENERKALLEKREYHTNLYNIYDNTQYAVKIFLNSIYGQLGSQYFPMFDIDNAEAITKSGQEIIKSAGKFVNDEFKSKYNSDLPNPVSGDTDSLYVDIQPLTDNVTKNDTLSDDEMRQVCKKVDELCSDINNFAVSFAKTTFNSDEVTIKFGREHYCSQGAFLAKKRYVIRSMNKEGAKTSDGQYLIKESWKYTGVEIKKTEHPESVKEMLKEVIHECIKTKMSSDRYNREISKYYEKYKNFTPNDMAYWKGYNTVKESDGFLEAEKGTGLAAKAALYYNDMLKELQLTDKYEPIQLGDRFRLSYVVPTNPYGLTIIAWPDKYPEEFKQHFELDYGVMFKKIFLGAMKRFEDINNWSVSDPTEEVEFSLSDL